MLPETRRRYENRIECRTDTRRGRTTVARGRFKIVGDQRGISPSHQLRVRFVGIALSALSLVREKRVDSEGELGLIAWARHRGWERLQLETSLPTSRGWVVAAIAVIVIFVAILGQALAYKMGSSDSQAARRGHNATPPELRHQSLPP
jgi:hypothetical protein